MGLLDLHCRPPVRAAPQVRHSPPVAGENGSLVDSWEDGVYLEELLRKMRLSLDKPWQGLVLDVRLCVVEGKARTSSDRGNIVVEVSQNSSRSR